MTHFHSTLRHCSEGAREAVAGAPVSRETVTDRESPLLLMFIDRGRASQPRGRARSGCSSASTPAADTVGDFLCSTHN